MKMHHKRILVLIDPYRISIVIYFLLIHDFCSTYCNTCFQCTQFIINISILIQPHKSINSKSCLSLSKGWKIFILIVEGKKGEFYLKICSPHMQSLTSTCRNLHRNVQEQSANNSNKYVCVCRFRRVFLMCYLTPLPPT